MIAPIAFTPYALTFYRRNRTQCDLSGTSGSPSVASATPRNDARRFRQNRRTVRRRSASDTSAAVADTSRRGDVGRQLQSSSRLLADDDDEQNSDR